MLFFTAGREVYTIAVKQKYGVRRACASQLHKVFVAVLRSLKVFESPIHIIY